jgi:hypothetical protein
MFGKMDVWHEVQILSEARTGGEATAKRPAQGRPRRTMSTPKRAGTGARSRKE